MKKILILILFAIVLVPVYVNANNINEYPPYININNKEEYDIEKIIDSNTVTVRLKKKNERTFYSWTFDKNKVGETINLDFEILFDEDKEIKNKINKDIDVKYLTFKHHGTLPSKAKVTLYVGDKFKDKESLYLYYYNEDTNEIEYISDNIKVSQGYIQFEIDHCSKYFVTSSVLDGNNLVNNKNINYIIFGLMIISLGMIGKVLFIDD